MSIRVPYEEMKQVIFQAMRNAGLPEDKAEILAEIHTQSSRDGVESHGLNRIPSFLGYVRKGYINVNGSPSLVKAYGAVEHLDGNMGPGVTNALYAADRAAALAREHGIGLVTIRNTNHWMRGGTYAYRMAEQGLVGICWINTESCMPMWGSDVQSVGNNPFCIGVPREKGPIVLDMAMSQYAYGKLGVYELAGKETEYPCGYDEAGNVTCDPGAVIRSRRIMPTGYWKGSSMAIVLDLAAVMMAGGRSGIDMDAEHLGSCIGSSQIFIAYEPAMFGDADALARKVEARIEAVHKAHPITEGRTVQCPGEGTMCRRADSMAHGIRADETVWEEMRRLAGV